VAFLFFFFSSRRRHTRFSRDWSSDVCSSDLERLLKNSKLRYHALLEEIICKPERGLTREMLLRLSDGMFITKGENVLITGVTGKIGRASCRERAEIARLAEPLKEEARTDDAR